jgi:hypothetical protein
MRRIGLGIQIFSRFETLAGLALRRSRDEGKHLLASQKYNRQTTINLCVLCGRFSAISAI